MRIILRAFRAGTKSMGAAFHGTQAALLSSMAQDNVPGNQEDAGEQTPSEVEDMDDTLDDTQLAAEDDSRALDKSANNPANGSSAKDATIMPDDEIPPLDLIEQARSPQVRRSARIKDLASIPCLTRQPTLPTQPIRRLPRKQTNSNPPSVPGDPSIPVTAHSLLLELPGELRNRIYRYALLTSTTILLTRSSWSTHEPGLLRVNKQLRAEATQLFYYENEFSAEIDSYDGSVNNRFHALRTRYKTLRRQAHHHFSGGPNWGNLIDWLEKLHRGEMVGIHAPGIDKVRTVERKVVGACFRIAVEVKVLPWVMVKGLLESQHIVLAQIDGRWT